MVCNCCPRVTVTPDARRREAIGFLLAVVAVGVGILAALLAGCKSMPMDAPSYIRSGTSLAVSGGLAYLEARQPGDRDRIRTAAAESATVIETAILPLLDGAPTDGVARAVVDHALDLLAGKLPAGAAPFVRAGIDLVLSRVQLPQDPAGRLSPEARAAVRAFFAGADDGLHAYLGGRGVVPQTIPRGVARMEWR